MKQNLFNKLWLRVGMIVAIMTTALSGTAWANEVTISYGDTFSPALPTASSSVNTSATAHTVQGLAIKEVGIYKGSSNNYLMFAQNKGYLYNTTSLGTITKVEVTYSSGTSTTGKAGVYFGSTEQSTYTTTSNNTIKGQSQTDTWTNNTSNNGYFQLSTSSKNVQITQIKITYTPSGGSSLTTNDLTLNETSMEFDLADGAGQTFQLTNSGSADGALTYNSDNDAVATVSNTGLITAVGEGTATITVTQAQTSTYYGGEAECTVTVTDSRYTISNLAFTAKCDGSGTADDGTEWTVTSDGTESTFDSTSGIHYGTNNANVTYLQLATSDINGQVAKVVINARDAQATASITVTVGGNPFTCGDNASVTATNTSTDYTFTGTGSGEIVVRVDRGTSMAKAIYVKSVKVSYIPSTDPSISADDVDIAYDANVGSFNYIINNTVDGGTVSVEYDSDDDWLLSATANNGTVNFTCEANNTNAERLALVTITYTYGSPSQTVTKEVWVTQAAAPVIYTTISDLFEAATNTATEVNITFGGWVVSGVNGSQVFVTDGTNGFIIYQSGHGFEVGNTLSGTASCNLVLFNGSAQLTGLTSTTEGLTVGTNGSVTPVATTIGALGAVNTGSVVTLNNLTYNGSNLSDGTNTIIFYTSLYNETTLVNGKTYNVTGVFVLNNTDKRILPRSAADIEEVVVTTPSIVVADATVNVGAAGVDDGEITVTYNNITTVTAEIVFYTTSEATTVTTEPTWIVTEINSSNNVGYVVDENTSTDARTAYMKVKVGDVYSNLITITQAGVAPVVEAVALVGVTPSGVAYALSSDAAGSNKLAGVEVDIVNGKVINGQTDKISWYVTSSDVNATFVNKDNSNYLAKGSGNTDLTTQESSYNWTVEEDSWSVMVGSTKRSFIYNTQYSYFGCYAISNAGTTSTSGEYSESPKAYTFAEGYTRAVTADNYGTICLPYDVAAEDFSGVKFYKIASKKMSGETLVSVNLEEVTSLSAGCAYIFQANDDATKLIAAYSGEEAATPVAANASVTGLVGTYSRTAIPQGCYVLKDGQIWYVDQANYMFSGANKAYIDLTNVPAGSAGVKQIVLFCGDDDATGISLMEDGRSLMEDGVIYNVAGQRISKMQKGINIVNGKKIAVK